MMREVILGFDVLGSIDDFTDDAPMVTGPDGKPFRLPTHPAGMTYFRAEGNAQAPAGWVLAPRSYYKGGVSMTTAINPKTGIEEWQVAPQGSGARGKHFGQMFYPMKAPAGWKYSPKSDLPYGWVDPFAPAGSPDGFVITTAPRPGEAPRATPPPSPFTAPPSSTPSYGASSSSDWLFSSSGTPRRAKYAAAAAGASHCGAMADSWQSAAIWLAFVIGVFVIAKAVRAAVRILR